MLPAVDYPATIILILAGVGIGVSVLSILEKHVPAITAFCMLFGEGCQKTMDFTLLRVSIGWWGLVFYLVLIFLVLAAPVLVFPAVMAGVGFELTFLWILITIRAFCIFCMLNAVVIAGLFLSTFSMAVFWPAAAIALFFFMISSFLVSRENVEAMASTPMPYAEASDRPVARVNGEDISTRELELSIRQDIHDQEMQVYQLKRDRLEEMILERLGEKTVTKTPPTGAAERDQRQELIASLQKHHSIEILLEKPTLPFLDVDINGSPSIGPANAPVIIVEFSDYFCPHCRKMHPMKDHVRNAYGENVRWVFKDFPLDIHKGARKAAEAARCAGDQGKFWEYQALLFAHNETPDEDTLDAFARHLGLDAQQFQNCLASRTYRKKVEKDIKDGVSAGITATPTFLINQQKVTGSLSRDAFMATVEEELKNLIL